MTLEEALSLSALTAEKGEEERLRAEMNGIAAFAASLSEDVAAALEEAPPAFAPREDTPLPSFPREEMLRNARRARDGLCVVPRTVE